MVQALIVEGVSEWLQDMGLPYQITECSRSPFSGKYLITHPANQSRIEKAVALASHTPAHESETTVAPFRAWRGS